MAKYSNEEILEKYNKQRDKAIEKLKELDVYCGSEINFTGLNGWVFEQVIHYCITVELKTLGIQNPHIKEQYKLELGVSESGKKKHPAIIDLIIENKILIEIKGRGYKYGKQDDTKDDDRLRNIKKKAEEEGLVYLYITKEESKEPKNENSFDYRKRTREIIGGENCFFLDDEKEDNWYKFVNRVDNILKEKFEK